MLHAAAVLTALLTLFSAAPAAALQVRVVPAAPRQGDTVLVFVAGTKGAQNVEGSLGAQHLTFFPYGTEYAALAGVDLETKPGKVPWRIGLVDGDGASRKATGSVTIKAGGFPVERLTLPGGMVNLDPEAERRAANEAARMRAASGRHGEPRPGGGATRGQRGGPDARPLRYGHA